MADKMDLGKVAEARRFETISGVAEGTISFGKVAVRGTNEGQFTAFASDDNSQKIAGIAAFTLSGSIDDLEFDDEDAMRVLRKGVIVAKVSSSADTAPSAGDRVAVNPDGDVFTETEANSDSGSSGDYAAVLKNSEFVEGASAGDKVLIEVNFPMNIEWIQQA